MILAFYPKPDKFTSGIEHLTFAHIVQHIEMYSLSGAPN